MTTIAAATTHLESTDQPAGIPRLESLDDALQFIEKALGFIKERQTPKNVEMLRGTSVPRPYGGREVPQDVALAWLEKTHGAKLGDVVWVGGWTAPRAILIENFSIDENKKGEFFMWFEGPTAYPKGTERRINGTPAHSCVHRGTSKRIERFLSQERADLASRPAPAPVAPVVKAPAPPAEPAKVYPPAQRTDILARIHAAELAGDHEHQDSISLEWLEAVHDVRPGDYVQVPLRRGGTQVLYLTGARHAGLGDPDPQRHFLLLAGPFDDDGKGRYITPVFHITDPIRKVDERDVTKCLRDFVRRSKAKQVVAARELSLAANQRSGLGSREEA